MRAWINYTHTRLAIILYTWQFECTYSCRMVCSEYYILCIRIDQSEIRLTFTEWKMHFTNEISMNNIIWLVVKDCIVLFFKKKIKAFCLMHRSITELIKFKLRKMSSDLWVLSFYDSLKNHNWSITIDTFANFRMIN